MEVLACQRMVQVNGHLRIGDFRHASPEALSLFILQGNLRILLYMFAVKLSVYHESLLGEFHDALRVCFAVGIFLFDDEVESLFLGRGQYLLLKSIQCHPESAQEYKGALLGGFLDELFSTVVSCIEFIGDGQEFVLLIFHFVPFSLIWLQR